MKNSIGIVIQGPTDHYKKVLECFGSYGKNIVFSTWKTEPEVNLEAINKQIKVCIQPLPEEMGYGNINCQTLSSFVGVMELRECDYILKLRSDMIPTNLDKFLNSFIPNDKLTFLCWHKDGYLVDYLNFGKKELMVKFWDLYTTIQKPAEFNLLENFCTKCEIDYPFCYEDIKPRVNFCLKDIVAENDVHWLKNDTFLSSYKNYPECYFY